MCATKPINLEVFCLAELVLGLGITNYQGSSGAKLFSLGAFLPAPTEFMASGIVAFVKH